MDLKWWPITAGGILALIVIVLVAMVIPLPTVTRILRPLAHVKRLTELPEYARVARARFLALIITATLLAILFLAAIITAGRPTGFSSATRNFETLHPEDIMICVGEPVTDAATAGLLNYFTQQMKTFTTQRIGLTSPTLRVVPLTRNYDWAAQQFTAYANLSALQRDIDAGKKLGDHEVSELSNGITSFSRSINYTDYVRSVDDILALCMTGFPGFEDKSGHRRSLIYMGYSKIRADDDPRRSLYSTQTVKDMAARAGIQINAIARSDVLSGPKQSSESLSSIVAATGGRFSLYNPAGTGADPGSTDSTLSALLDRIRDAPPDVVLPSGMMITRRSWDYPTLPVSISLVAAILLSVSLAVLRR
ncbi:MULTISPECIES: hypothetical protein [Mycobacterium avium complex (MAC)]|uniref:Uncharacterized protein n=1 Tax=Mycobacterium intracellulare subsp. chimaera TaxID=222805 RepID=A0ABT7P839_MYCIT|nr:MULTISPECIES: hypothetical protein [Mycobacterium avium complex (MAC)]AOS94888.2 hypothetical protein AN480_27845 [Mycobacterium intracellulare subsp. chimaera]MDM3929261.1 hypothetical protein [Mycobacterium intracellulare subsp. chimaera]PBA69010.1 hypothetical protein CKJ76_25340 [Mycobacterium avium]